MRKSKLLCVLALSTLFVSCSGEKVHEQEKVSIKDIDWKFELGILDGERLVLFKYTNNSDYVIHELKLTLTPSSKFTDDKLDKFYEEFKVLYYADDEDIEEIRKEKLTFDGEHDSWDDPVNPGESYVSEASYFQFLEVYNMDYYEYFELDLMTIVYEEDNMLYTTYYDYKNNSYSHELEPEPID